MEKKTAKFCSPESYYFSMGISFYNMGKSQCQWKNPNGILLGEFAGCFFSVGAGG